MPEQKQGPRNGILEKWSPTFPRVIRAEVGGGRTFSQKDVTSLDIKQETASVSEHLGQQEKWFLNIF